ncbi:MAG: TetR family transcriptional regulator [Halioglobus sp.]|nr:TetR family transcriptional regulator [Halioglobus sp.]
MSDTSTAGAGQPARKKRQRRTQERTEITRAKLLEAATRLFTEHGYEGVSIRDIENQAGVQRGLLAYHFQDKESLWKAMADATFTRLHDELHPRLELLGDLSMREQIAFIVRFYVRFTARHPELARLLSQEARHDSWRIRYLVENHINALADNLRDPVREALGLDERQFMHWYYLLAGGSSLIFSHAPECRLVFGQDPQDDGVVDAHAEVMVSALLGPRE